MNHNRGKGLTEYQGKAESALVIALTVEITGKS
jgi:hypothetical protein